MDTEAMKEEVLKEPGQVVADFFKDSVNESWPKTQAMAIEAAQKLQQIGANLEKAVQEDDFDGIIHAISVLSHPVTQETLLLLAGVVIARRYKSSSES